MNYSELYLFKVQHLQIQCRLKAFDAKAQALPSGGSVVLGFVDAAHWC